MMIALVTAACSTSQKPDSRLAEAAEKFGKHNGERIDGPANVRETPNGRILFSLETGVPIETAQDSAAQDWIKLLVQITIADGDSLILPGKKLVDVNGKTVGKTIDTTRVVQYDETTGFIYGVTHRKNLLAGSVPEIELEKALQKKQFSLKELKPFADAAGFEKALWYDMEGDLSQHVKDAMRKLTVSYVLESMYEDPSPRPRISLAFGESGNLVYFTHQRAVRSGFETEPLIRGHYITWIPGTPDSLRALWKEGELWMLNHSD
jgi:hypothetical protein